MANPPNGHHHGGHDDGDRASGRVVFEDPDAGDGDLGQGGDDVPPRLHRSSGGMSRVEWIVSAVILVILLLMAVDWVDWRLGIAVFIPVLFVAIVIVGILALMAKGDGGHGEAHDDDHGEEDGGHGHSSFLTRVNPFGVRLLKPDQQVVWTNRLVAGRGSHEPRAVHHHESEGWFTGLNCSWLQWGRVALGIPVWREPTHIVDTSSQEEDMQLTANPGGESMTLSMRVRVQVIQDRDGAISPHTARLLVVELEEEPWTAVRRRVQSALQDSIGHLGFNTSLQLVPSAETRGEVEENWRLLEANMRGDESHPGTLQQVLNVIGFQVLEADILDTHSAAAEQAQEARVRHGAGINPNVGLVVDGLKELAQGLLGRRGGGKSSGGRGGKARTSHNHPGDEEDED